jgi:hypothetical protein
MYTKVIYIFVVICVLFKGVNGVNNTVNALTADQHSPIPGSTSDAVLAAVNVHDLNCYGVRNKCARVHKDSLQDDDMCAWRNFAGEALNWTVVIKARCTSQSISSCLNTPVFAL